MRRSCSILSTVFIVCCFTVRIGAQNSPPSIFVFENSSGGMNADTAAASMEQQLFDALWKQYPCMDMMDKWGIESMIEYQRMIDLLGGKPNDELLAQLAGAMGARYVVSVHATQLPNGTVYLSVSVFDSVTNKTVVMRDAPPVTDTNPAIARLKDQVLADMAKFLQGKCDEHWTGTITYKYKFEGSKPTKNDGIASIADYSNARTTGENQTTASDETFVVLKPMSLGSTNPTHPGVMVTRQFEYHHMQKTETTMQVRCRPRGANSYLRPTKESHFEKMDETGQAKGVRSVYVDVRSDGTYVITMNLPVDVPTKWMREDTEQRPDGCEDPPPVTASSRGEDSVFAAGYKRAGGEIRAKFDPRNPDELKGSETTGNADIGVLTIAWNLKRVRPKARNEK